MKSKIDKIASVAIETTGINFNADNPAKNHQILSCGILIADAHTYVPIDGIYKEVKFNREAIWNTNLEPIHGFTIKYLDEHGIAEEQLAAEIANIFLNNFGNDPVVLLSHNTCRFAQHFIRDILNKYQLDVPISSRMLDTFTVAKLLFDLDDSKEILKKFGGDNKMNAIEKAELYLKVFKSIKERWSM